LIGDKLKINGPKKPPKKPKKLSYKYIGLGSNRGLCWACCPAKRSKLRLLLGPKVGICPH